MGKNAHLIKEIDEQIKRLEKRKALLKEEEDRLHPDEKVDKFLKTYHGKDLLSKHKLTDLGIWEVKGEDSNADFHGSHVEPTLGHYSGELIKVLEIAVHLPRFWAWGAGGRIVKVEPINVVKL